MAGKAHKPDCRPEFRLISWLALFWITVTGPASFGVATLQIAGSKPELNGTGLVKGKYCGLACTCEARQHREPADVMSYLTLGLVFSSSELPSSDILPVSSTYSLDIVDNNFLALRSTSSMLTPRLFGSLSASKMLSTNIGMSRGQRRRQMQFQDPAQWLSMPSPDGSC